MRRIFALLIALPLLLAPLPARADGIIIDPCRLEVNCPPEVPLFPLTIQYHRVTVTIENQVAVTQVDQLFRNDTGRTVEGTYIFPVPAEAGVSEFSMWVDEQKLEGKILTAAEARQIYTDIVRQARDPALLEYVGRGAVQASVFPIPPGATRRIELKYTQVLVADNGLFHYRYPLNTEKFSARPLEQVSVSVTAQSPEPVHAIYSPSHPLAITRADEHHFTAGYEANRVTPTTDFDLYYSVAAEDLGVNLLTYRDPATQAGFFLLLAAPALRVETDQVVAKDVIFVLDKSGSMEGTKFQQTQAALKYVLQHLNPADRFNIIAFSTDLVQYARELQPAAQVAAATRWVDTLAPGGSTDINRALLEALSMTGAQPAYLIFLTDGLPTEGVVDTDQILANVAQATSAAETARLFAFGVGDDVDTILLDTLVEQNHGTANYVRPSEQIDEAVSGFYAKVSTPVLSNVTLELGAANAFDQYPQPLPDLFAGGQLIVVGRYQNPGPTELVVKGTVNGVAKTFAYPLQNFTAAGGSDFIPRLWATRKIGYLLNQIRLHGETKETIDQIVQLSVRYGIVTPYTSYLVTETDQVLTEAGRDNFVIELESAAAAATPAPASGGAAVDKAEAVSDLVNSTGAVAPDASAAPVVKMIGQRTFVYSQGVWVDTAFDATRMTSTPVEFASADYFALLETYPELAGPFALGPHVVALTEAGAAYAVDTAAAPPLVIPPTATPLPTDMPPANTTPIAAVTPLPGTLPAPTQTLVPLYDAPGATPGRGQSGLCGNTLLPVVGLAALPFLLRRRR